MPVTDNKFEFLGDWLELSAFVLFTARHSNTISISIFVKIQRRGNTWEQNASTRRPQRDLVGIKTMGIICFPFGLSKHRTADLSLVYFIALVDYMETRFTSRSIKRALNATNCFKSLLTLSLTPEDRKFIFEKWTRKTQKGARGRKKNFLEKRLQNPSDIAVG